MKATADGNSLRKPAVGDNAGERANKSETQNLFPKFRVHILTVFHYKHTVRCRDITTHFLEKQVSTTSIHDLTFNWDVSTCIFSTCSDGSLP